MGTDRPRPAPQATGDDRTRVNRIAAQTLLLLLLWAAAQADVFSPVERAILEYRFELASVEPTGDTVVIEMDRRSMDAVSVWPWPRGYFAIMIHRLREAGARNIAFTIGFANRTTMEADGQLAMAIEHAKGKVILPTYSQSMNRASLRDFAGARPLTQFSAYARLAGADYLVDSNGMAISVPSVQQTGEGPVLAMGALLAGRYGHDATDIRVDYSIDPTRIPSLSFLDVYNGTFDPEIVRGRDVILGGTSRPFGEPITVPIYGSIPSVYFHALVAETLKLGRNITIVPDSLAMGLVAAPYLLFLPILVRRRWQQQAIILSGVIVLLFVASLAIFQVAAIHVEIMASVAFLCGGFVLESVMQQERLAATVASARIEGAYRQALMESVVSESFDGILIVDDGGTVRLANRTAAALIGISVEEIVGAPIARLAKSLRPPGDPIAPPFIGFDLPERTPVSRRIRSISGEVLELEVVASHIRVSLPRTNGMPTVGRHAEIFAFRDITVRKRAEEAERRAHEELRQASRAKSEFIANMSHELRTPLNAIIGFSELMKAQVYGPMGAPQYADYANDVLRSGQLLLSIVNDLLDVSQIESGTFPCDRQPCSPEEIVDSLGPILRTFASTKSRSIAVEMPGEPLEVFADPRLLKQILINLLSNAVKFTAEGGSIRLRVRAAGGSAEFSVTDDGIGIPPEALSKVTDAFFQVDGSNARHHEGVGLGLFIVSRYVQLLGGTLAIESELGRGTTVRVVLPRADGASACGSAA